MFIPAFVSVTGLVTCNMGGPGGGGGCIWLIDLIKGFPAGR